MHCWDLASTPHPARWMPCQSSLLYLRRWGVYLRLGSTVLVDGLEGTGLNHHLGPGDGLGVIGTLGTRWGSCILGGLASIAAQLPSIRVKRAVLVTRGKYYSGAIFNFVRTKWKHCRRSGTFAQFLYPWWTINLNILQISGWNSENIPYGCSWSALRAISHQLFHTSKNNRYSFCGWILFHRLILVSITSPQGINFIKVKAAVIYYSLRHLTFTLPTHPPWYRHHKFVFIQLGRKNVQYH